MSRGTVRIVLLLVSAYCVIAIRQPLAVLEPLDPATLVSTLPQAAADIIVVSEAATSVEPATAAADVAAVPIDSTLVAPTDTDAVLPTDSMTDVGVSAQSTHTAVTALAGNTLGIGFSGSGFLVMYHVGVTAVLRNLGIINSNVKFAGASGGSVAAAYSCAADSSLIQRPFRDAAATSASFCRLANNCQGTLDLALGKYLLVGLPLGVVADCANKLFIAVTSATNNQLPVVNDTRQFVTVSPTDVRLKISEALAASSYIPRFSGLSAVTRPSIPIFGGLTIPVAYDGVATDPLPVPPTSAGVTFTITVSAVVNETNPEGGPPTTFFDRLVDTVNQLGGLDLNACPTKLSRSTCYTPLNPRKEAQPTSVDIYPGLDTSSPRAFNATTWNNFALSAPSQEDNKKLYNQGRNDARAWVRATFPAITDATLDAAMAATAADQYNVW